MDPMSNVRFGLNASALREVPDDLLACVAREQLLSTAGVVAVWAALDDDTRRAVYRASPQLEHCLKGLRWQVEVGERQINAAAAEGRETA